MTDAQLAEDARRSYPGYRVARIARARNPDQAVDVWLRRGNRTRMRLFDPRTGRDLGDSVPTGIWLVSKLMDLHDNLLAGPTGREVNGGGAVVLIVAAATGFVIWWPGSKTWRRSLTLHRGLGWKRFTWHLHSMAGFWSLAFTLVFGVSGVYLAFPEPLQEFADRIEPPTAANAGFRVVDRVIYWLAFLHFGRINGIGIPCSGPGFCDQATKAVWAIFGLAPALMFVTGGGTACCAQAWQGSGSRFVPMRRRHRDPGVDALVPLQALPQLVQSPKWPIPLWLRPRPYPPVLAARVTPPWFA